ncbi:hypothetical protein K2X30_10330 [bacterium]|nr:hypothetical protein [bacterium]
MNKLKKGNYKTQDGTEVEVEEHYSRAGFRPVWIGHIKSLGPGNPQGVVTWSEDGKVASYGVTEDYKKKLAISPE